MWVDTMECVPFKDGEYLVQTVYGSVTAMNYTYKGGWNTHIDKDGNVCDKHAQPSMYVVRWFIAPQPPTVPDEWREKYIDHIRKERGLVCGTE